MFRWIEDNQGDSIDLSVKKTTCASAPNSEISELVALMKNQKDILDRQQKQIDELIRGCVMEDPTNHKVSNQNHAIKTAVRLEIEQRT